MSLQRMIALHPVRGTPEHITSAMKYMLKLELGHTHRPSTPAGVVVFTPAASPSSSTELVVFETLPMVVSSTLRHTLRTPWAQFQNLIGSTTFPKWNLRKQSKSVYTGDIDGALRIADVLCPSEESTQLEGIIKILRPEIPCSNAMLILQKPESYLPKARIGSLDARVRGVISTSNKTPEADLMKLLIGTISNNLETHDTTTLVMELIEDQKYDVLLKDLLVQKLDTVSAFAEKLLELAAYLRKWDLVKALVESGADADIRSEEYQWVYSQTALHHAADDNNIDMVRYLIEKGARDFSVTFDSRSGRARSPIEGTILDLAVDKGHRSLVRFLLNNENIKSGRFPKVTMSMFRNAIILGHIHIVRLFLDSYPGLHKAARASPWLFYEAAAVCQDENEAIRLVDLLRMYGFDIEATDAFGRGNILAAASIVPHIAMIENLLAAEIWNSSVAVGQLDGSGSLHNDHEVYADILRRVSGKSALHVAVSEGHENLVKLLLSHGADVNQDCGLRPIQLAASESNSTIVALLIEAGADIHAIQYSEHCPSSSDPDSLLPAILLALCHGHIRSAELLHHAGATIPDHVKESQFRGYQFENLFRTGSQRLILSFARRLLAHNKLATNHSRDLARRFGDDFLNDLAGTGVQITAQTSRIVHTTQTSGTIHTTQTPEIFALVEKAHKYYFAYSEAMKNSRGPPGYDEQQILEYIEQTRGISPSDGVRVLILAVRRYLTSTAVLLLQMGLSPFEPIPNAPDDVPSNVDRRHHLHIGDSAFIESVVLKHRLMVEIFLDCNPECMSGVHNILRHQQICKAYILALREDYDFDWLSELFLHHGFDGVVVAQALGQDYLRKVFYNELLGAIRAGQYTRMDQILRYHGLFGDLVNPPDLDDGRTPLQQLVVRNQIQHVRTLLSLGADVNAKATKFGSATALQYAVRHGNFEVLDILIKAGADVNAPPADDGGRTAIEGAAEWGRLDIVHYLLEAGANIQLRENYRNTIYRAWEGGHHTIARMVYKWKKEKYGEVDCESIERVMEIMTPVELDDELSDFCDVDEDASESDVD
jgi:ankyrin repeat protein